MMRNVASPMGMATFKCCVNCGDDDGADEGDVLRSVLQFIPRGVALAEQGRETVERGIVELPFADRSTEGEKGIVGAVHSPNLSRP